ncbi:MAG TPA: hypothetical protein VMU83_13085 [Hanamia sp.]|nr:hypothetical protein [Hanamia sp.]
MKGRIILKGLIAGFLLISLPGWLLADTGGPVCHFKFTNLSVSDSIPPSSQVKSTTVNDQSNEEVKTIEVVPKARRQPVPVPVTVEIKPIKIIKPKIIKPIIRPVIKILH